MSEMIRPNIRLRPDTRVRAWVLGKKFSSSIALRTFAAVAGFTFSESLIVRETVAVETLALFATSFMFMRTCGKRPGEEKRYCTTILGQEKRMQKRRHDRIKYLP